MKKKFISGVVIQQDTTLSLNELAQVCSVPRKYINELVEPFSKL